jgi:hypothetical protein
MGYYDGNTVTALWNYAQHYAMSDNSFDTELRPLDAGRAQPGLRTAERRDRQHQRHRLRHPRRRGRPDRHRRCRSPRRRLLDHNRRTLLDDGTTIGDMLNQGHQLGLLHAGLRSDRHQRQRHHRLQTQHHLARHQHQQGRLHSAPRAFPVLQIDREPHPCAPHLGVERGPDRRRQPPVRRA